MKRTIRIGTRESDLSIAQTMLVVEALKECHPDLECELVPRRTLGDKLLDQPLVDFGGKGVFITEFEQALLQGEIDLAGDRECASQGRCAGCTGFSGGTQLLG